MTTHLSARLAWHDRGWDGRVCDAPHLNASCIVHKHIRHARDDDRERESAGKPLAKLQDALPPCSRDPAAYAERGFTIEHRDPLDFRRLPPVSEAIPPYSVCSAPYRWMREDCFQEVCDAENLSIRGPDEERDHGWIQENDRQRELLGHFWKKLEVEQSLIFYYCNRHGHPLDEDASHILIGVGRISEIGEQVYFGTTGKYPKPFPVWSRRVTQDYPGQGVRIPYQEYLRGGRPMDGIICRIPRSAVPAFSYGGEHVSDDIAVTALERIIQSVEQVRADGHVDGDWDRRLEWLSDALAEVWTGRGAFPGAGSVLRHLGFAQGMAFHRMVLLPMERRGENPWAYTLSLLNGEAELDGEQYRAGLLQARERWGLLSGRQALLSKLARFDLSPAQVDRISNPDMRRGSGIGASDEELVANPYILYESDRGTKDSERVDLEAIDHGMRPEGEAGRFPDGDGMVQDDRRRIRALGVAVLEEASDMGDTVLEFGDFLDRISERFTERRACRPDRDVVLAEPDWYRKRLWLDLESEPKLVALKHLQELEQHLVARIKRRAGKMNPVDQSSVDWAEALRKEFGPPDSGRERQALEEKGRALEVLLARRLSILTGSAGTGKTTVLKVFLQELVQVEGHQPMLLLAPTGKARVRLSTRTGRNAMTIHQFLLKQGWLDPGTFTLLPESDQPPCSAKTVVIDECSMIPTDLFGTLMRAIDSGPLTRLILVGDPNQLPPIGPGRPFVDIIRWLRGNHPECMASLSTCMRTSGAEDSVALRLAEGYRESGVNRGHDEILAAIACGKAAGDLDVAFWEDRGELLEALRSRMSSLLGVEARDYKSFNRSLGIDAEEWKRSEDWQILSPSRAHYFGTGDINRLVQKEYKGGLIAKAKGPKPFGEQEIVYTDKVIQVVNQRMKAWPRDANGLDYVANGEVGVVKWVGSGDYGPFLDAVFATQPDVSYRYSSKRVEENLELAYALTVHKAQGSDFETVFLIIPQEASTLSRELLYTGLTRFRGKLVLLIQKDIEPLLRLRSLEASEIQQRSTRMFLPESESRTGTADLLHGGAFRHRTQKGDAVRSKSEVIVAGVLDFLGISYEYERRLDSRSDRRDFRIPDFTVSFEGDIYYWEHLGMLNVEGYRDAWKRKHRWYEDNGYAEQLIVSKDDPDGGIDAGEIERIARERILEE